MTDQEQAREAMPDSTQGDGALPRDQSGSPPGVVSLSAGTVMTMRGIIAHALAMHYRDDGLSNAPIRCACGPEFEHFTAWRLHVADAVLAVLSETGLPGPGGASTYAAGPSTPVEEPLLTPPGMGPSNRWDDEPGAGSAVPVFRRVPSPTPEADPT